MAASVRTEDEAFSDVRFDVLADLCGLADADHARGKMQRLWRQCTMLGTYVLPASTIAAVLGPRGAESLVESGLGELSDGGIRVRGTRGRIEWLKKLRRNAQKGGRAKAAKRQEVGRTKAAKSLPPPCPPAPAPAPSGSEKKNNGHDPGMEQAISRTEASLGMDIGVRRKGERTLLERLHADRYEAVRAALGADVRPLNLAGQGERWLVECLMSRGDAAGGLEAAVADCHRALANREKQAMQLKTMRFFGPGMWESEEFTAALGWTAEDIAKMGKGRDAAPASKPPEFKRLT